jgi:hypothetical protein
MLAIIAHRNGQMTPPPAPSPPGLWRPPGAIPRLGRALSRLTGELAAWIFVLGGLLSLAKYTALALVWGGNVFLRVRARIPV